MWGSKVFRFLGYVIFFLVLVLKNIGEVVGWGYLEMFLFFDEKKVIRFGFEVEWL